MKTKTPKTPKPRLEPGDDLGVQWERWADGRAFRLKRKRDFGDVDPGLARDAATNAAAKMGKVVQTTRDRQFPDKFIWVQFADHKIRIGDPCPCGSRRLHRLHTHFARCPECGSQILLSTSGLDEEEDRLAARLGELKDVHLARLEESDGDALLYRGYGEKDGALVLLLAEFRLEPGEELTPENAIDRLERVKMIPFQLLAGLVDPSSLAGREESYWDLVL